MITALAGGIGAAKFLIGLTKSINPKDLTIIVNTGDDIKMHGLHISPDIDIITYTLAGIVDTEKGWGIRADTFHCLETLGKLGQETWFNLGDKDLATHLFRTALMKKGLSLSEITAIISKALGVEARILPMTDDEFETRVRTRQGDLHFEEYLVKRGAKDDVLSVEFRGADHAKPAPGVLDSIMRAERVIVCPSNPVVSIGTILAVNGVRQALRQTNARKIAVSPIIAGAPVKGPADKLMMALGLEVSAYSVAKLYSDFVDAFVIDTTDSREKSRIEELGIEVKVTDTIMRTVQDKIRLANMTLEN